MVVEEWALDPNATVFRSGTMETDAW